MTACAATSAASSRTRRYSSCRPGHGKEERRDHGLHGLTSHGRHNVRTFQSSPNLSGFDSTDRNTPGSRKRGHFSSSLLSNGRAKCRLSTVLIQQHSFNPSSAPRLVKSADIIVHFKANAVNLNLTYFNCNYRALGNLRCEHIHGLHH